MFSVETALCNLDPQLLTVSRYLFPFVLEYSLIAIGAMTCIIFTGIGPTRDSHGHSQVARGFKNLIRVFSYKNKLRQQSTDTNIGRAIRLLLPSHSFDSKFIIFCLDVIPDRILMMIRAQVLELMGDLND